MDQPLLIILRQTETSQEKVRNIHTMVAMLREQAQGPTHWGQNIYEVVFELNFQSLNLSYVEYCQYFIFMNERYSPDNFEVHLVPA